MSPLSAREHLLNNLTVLLALVVVDRAIIEPFVRARLGKATHRSVGTTRWFFLHAFGNAFIVLAALGSMRATLRDPTRAMDGNTFHDATFFGDASVWPLTIVNSLHVYHLIGGFGLTAADRFHHYLFIPTLGFPGQYYRWGALGNVQAFFISGLPGGIDYFLLGLCKARARGVKARAREYTVASRGQSTV